MSLLLNGSSLCLIIYLAKLSSSISHWIVEGDCCLCLLWKKSNSKGTQATLDYLAELYSEATAKRKKKKYPFLPRYGDHMIERNSRLQGVGLSMISVTRCHICVIKQTPTLAHGLWPVLSWTVVVITEFLFFLYQNPPQINTGTQIRVLPC